MSPHHNLHRQAIATKESELGRYVDTGNHHTVNFIKQDIKSMMLSLQNFIFAIVSVESLYPSELVAMT